MSLLFDTCVHTRPITHTCGRMLCNMEMIITVSVCKVSIQNVINIYDHYLYITNIHISPPFSKSVCKFRSCRLYIYIYIQFTCPMCTVSIHVYTIEDCTTGIALILVKDHFSLVHCNDILSTHKIMYVK